jgi:mRNA-degrading endonuclease toxin of MazEF toxin-antitoxin module
MKHSFVAGETIRVNLGNINEVQGHEQALVRPCVVVKVFANFELAIILPITSSAKISYYTIVPLLKGTAGLTIDSYVHCHQIRTVSFERIIESIGKLDTRDFFKIQAVLSDTLGLL